MFLTFFTELRRARVPVTPREYLDLVRALELDVADHSIEDFYRLARATLVKDERQLDKFDVVFAAVFKGILSLSEAVEAVELPEEWLRKLAEKFLTPEERAEIEKLGFEKLMETLRQRLAEQKGRHQGGSKWIGTGGTSPFGAYGDHPEGVRIGQDKSRRGSAVKVWDKREFKDFAGDEALGPRNIRIALRRLRRFAREGAEDELDLDGTIRSTADKGYIDVKLRPERRNAVKVLLFLDVGGSMDWHVEPRRRCSPPRGCNSSGSSISISTIVSTRASGATIAADSTSARRPPACSTPTVATIAPSSSATLR